MTLSCFCDLGKTEPTDPSPQSNPIPEVRAGTGHRNRCPFCMHSEISFWIIKGSLLSGWLVLHHRGDWCRACSSTGFGSRPRIHRQRAVAHGPPGLVLLSGNAKSLKCTAHCEGVCVCVCVRECVCVWECV